MIAVLVKLYAQLSPGRTILVNSPSPFGMGCMVCVHELSVGADGPLNELTANQSLVLATQKLTLGPQTIESVCKVDWANE